MLKFNQFITEATNPIAFLPKDIQKTAYENRWITHDGIVVRFSFSFINEAEILKNHGIQILSGNNQAVLVKWGSQWFRVIEWNRASYTRRDNDGQYNFKLQEITSREDGGRRIHLINGSAIYGNDAVFIRASEQSFNTIHDRYTRKYENKKLVVGGISVPYFALMITPRIEQINHEFQKINPRHDLIFIDDDIHRNNIEERRFMISYNERMEDIFYNVGRQTKFATPHLNNVEFYEKYSSRVNIDKVKQITSTVDKILRILKSYKP